VLKAVTNIEGCPSMVTVHRLKPRRRPPGPSQSSEGAKAVAGLGGTLSALPSETPMGCVVVA